MKLNMCGEVLFDLCALAEKQVKPSNQRGFEDHDEKDGENSFEGIVPALGHGYCTFRDGPLTSWFSARLIQLQLAHNS